MCRWPLTLAFHTLEFRLNPRSVFIFPLHSFSSPVCGFCSSFTDPHAPPSVFSSPPPPRPLSSPPHSQYGRREEQEWCLDRQSGPEAPGQGQGAAKGSVTARGGPGLSRYARPHSFRPEVSASFISLLTLRQTPFQVSLQCLWNSLMCCISKIVNTERIFPCTTKTTCFCKALVIFGCHHMLDGNTEAAGTVMWWVTFKKARSFWKCFCSYSEMHCFCSECHWCDPGYL